MHSRAFGRTGWQVSEISFGAWAIGSAWGTVDDDESYATLNHAVDLGVTLFDTADVYGDGRSEQLLARLKRERKEDFRIITKAGRRLNPHVADGYNEANLTAFVERSLRNLDTDCLDLVQLHCPPTEVYYRPEVFGVLDKLVQAGKILHYGVSVEKVEEALKAIEYPGVQSVQIIFNIFRQRPAHLFFEQAKRREVAVIVRLPLSSGALTGKMTRNSQFEQDDHRNFNRQGEAFDMGETFSGFDYETQLEAIEVVRANVPQGMTMAQFALRWILMFDAVTCAIPGAKRPSQVEDNCRSSELPPLSDEVMEAMRVLYETKAAPFVHHRW